MPRCTNANKHWSPIKAWLVLATIIPTAWMVGANYALSVIRETTEQLVTYYIMEIIIN